MSADRWDFLDEIVDERRERNPEFSDLVQAALERRAARADPAVAAGPRPTQRLSARSTTDEPPRRRRGGAKALEER